jgi:hypothetical protein
MTRELVPATFSITEDDVKQRFIPFLKDFYRNRYEPLPNTLSVNFDNISEGGVVADGMLQFRKPDGSLFTCTYEATSRDKIGEVKYTLNINYFIWDCAAFGALSAALIYVAFFRSEFLWLVKLHGPGNIGLVLGAFLIGFLGWYFTMQRWRKYRFIHAIAQFEAYRADEQWIALAEDVFPSPVDPYRAELREQCVFYGYGLAIVPAEGRVQPLVAPSRIGIYAENRKMVHWVTRAQWYQNTTKGFSPLLNVRTPDKLTAVWNKISRPVQFHVIQPFQQYFWAFITNPLHQNNNAYTRFMSGRVLQKWVFGAAMGLIVLLSYQVMSVREEEVATLEDLQQYIIKQNPEDDPGYIIDGEAIPYNGQPTGVPKQYPEPVEKEAIE